MGTPAVAESLSVEPAKDNTLFGFDDGSASSGAGQFLFCGQSGGQVGDPIQHRPVLAFDLSDIPPGSNVTDVTLTLTLLQASPFGGTDSMTLHKLLADWGEGMSNSFGGSGVPAQTDDATWLHTFYPDQFWASPGGDFAGAVSSSQNVSTTPGVYTWTATPQMIADVQQWVDDPDTNFGWIMMGNEAQTFTAKKFFSSEAAADDRPSLTVEYEPSCPWDCDGSGDGNSNVSDLLAMLSEYDVSAPMNCDGGSCDYDGNHCVDVSDLLKLLSHYATDPSGIGCP